MVKPSASANTFSEYASLCFIPYIEAQLQQARRVDVVWDEVHSKRQSSRSYPPYTGSITAAHQTQPSPTEWGWVFGANGWQPFWTNLPEVTASCRELVKCGIGCTKGCRGNCSCKKSNLNCTALCSCSEECANN